MTHTSSEPLAHAHEQTISLHGLDHGLGEHGAHDSDALLVVTTRRPDILQRRLARAEDEFPVRRAHISIHSAPAITTRKKTYDPTTAARGAGCSFIIAALPHLRHREDLLGEGVLEPDGGAVGKLLGDAVGWADVARALVRGVEVGQGGDACAIPDGLGGG